MPLAFFDFDGTLVRKDSGVVCAIPSIRRGLLGPRAGARVVSTYLLSKAGLRTRADAQRAGFACYAGRTLEELRAVMADLYAQHLRAFVSEPMRARVEAHRARGDRLVVLTASAFFFAEPLAADLGLDEVVGTEVEFAGGVCTGRVEGEILDGPEKLAAARAVAARHGEELARSTFYSDHAADLPLLEAVGTPVVVGPSRAFERLARARGWPVVRHDEGRGKLAPT
ncbi:MAG TPA: HAD-IB family hydrolase [Minicystis sp.]|nr:HAD-IB family hydrolase [Minicystis sp.]